jgi:hypothetical protein
MARRKGELPKIRLHKPSGSAVVNVGGKKIYLGKYGSAESQDRYTALLDEYFPSDTDSQLKYGVRDATPIDQGNGTVFGSQLGFSGRYPALPESWYYPSLLPQQIPDVSAVYIVLNSRYEVIYVGETQSMRRRYAEHKRWMRRRHKFSWIEVTPAERLFVQSHFIASLRPTKNKLGGTRVTAPDSGVVFLQPVKLMVIPANKPLPMLDKEVAHRR